MSSRKSVREVSGIPTRQRPRHEDKEESDYGPTKRTRATSSYHGEIGENVTVRKSKPSTRQKVKSTPRKKYAVPISSIRDKDGNKVDATANKKKSPRTIHTPLNGSVHGKREHDYRRKEVDATAHGNECSGPLHSRLQPSLKDSVNAYGEGDREYRRTKLLVKKGNTTVGAGTGGNVSQKVQMFERGKGGNENRRMATRRERSKSPFSNKVLGDTTGKVANVATTFKRHQHHSIRKRKKNTPTKGTPRNATPAHDDNSCTSQVAPEEWRIGRCDSRDSETSSGRISKEEDAPTVITPSVPILPPPRDNRPQLKREEQRPLPANNDRAAKRKLPTQQTQGNKTAEKSNRARSLYTIIVVVGLVTASITVPVKVNQARKSRTAVSPTFSPAPSLSMHPSVSQSPSEQPSLAPTSSLYPSSTPTLSLQPSSSPSSRPTLSQEPSGYPSVSHVPSSSPSAPPSVSVVPSTSPSSSPSVSLLPSMSPTVSSQPSSSPSVSFAPSNSGGSAMIPSFHNWVSAMLVLLYLAALIP